MIVHAFGPAWNTIDLSPFVVKLLTWLRMAQLPCTTQVANVRKMSNAKLPAMTLDDGQLVNDSQQIIDLLRELHQDPLDEQRWSPAEQAVACAWRSLFETDLYFAAYYQRWVPEPNFAILRPVMADYMGALGVPAFARALAVKAVRRSVLAFTPCCCRRSSRRRNRWSPTGQTWCATTSGCCGSIGRSAIWRRPDPGSASDAAAGA
ncbi:Tom37 metaxin N-terminal-like domain-containing protein [Variovorax saccharolyticus]|uniref:Tom37 metaxin N-terminal-like domain-containing protein n=1 Tax=Variovorax saccharolyticus TaxID=3053516 RepID=UPI002576D73B|nr:Tom37 metaxin N-terminal-like domain-containing protein [Variovorax sp. J22R187]MDM0020073.1 Tom37 metaxin N-terminal-like domain-containing protein [Variovorax sp. J22R187]